MLLTLLAAASSVALAAKTVSLSTDDGVALKASAQLTAGASRGVILLHMDGRDRSDWDYLGERIGRSGMTAIAPDLRGHGASSGSRDYPSMVRDVSAAVGWLKQQGVTEISCVGAELGANLCLAAAAQDERITAIAALSPQLNLRGIVAPKAMKGYAGTALIVASTDDPDASRCADILAKLAGDRAEYAVLTDAGSGIRMINRDPALEGRILEYLSGAVDLSGDISAGFRPDTTDDTTVEAEGEKLRIHQ